MDNEASYICDHCGEDIVVPIDFSAGSSQQYVEDCSVCCRPILLKYSSEAGTLLEFEAQAEGGE